MADESDRVKPTPSEAVQALVGLQRELNAELVLSSLRAQEEAEASELREATLVAQAELREQLLGILGHDLRAPLGSIRMAGATLLHRGNLSPEDHRVVEMLLKSAVRMSGMITQILDFTRARLGGGVIIDRRPTDLGEVCQSIVDELALGTSVSLRCVVVGHVTASLDPDRLAEALSNLASNALEHASAGTGVVLRVYDDTEHLVVEISNLGDPIPEDVMPFIFEPFRRARQREHSPAGNLGLGLYIASEITRAHGGTLRACSSGGRTTFTMRLPRTV